MTTRNFVPISERKLITLLAAFAAAIEAACIAVYLWDSGNGGPMHTDYHIGGQLLVLSLIPMYIGASKFHAQRAAGEPVTAPSPRDRRKLKLGMLPFQFLLAMQIYNVHYVLMDHGPYITWSSVFFASFLSLSMTVTDSTVRKLVTWKPKSSRTRVTASPPPATGTNTQA